VKRSFVRVTASENNRIFINLIQQYNGSQTAIILYEAELVNAVILHFVARPS